MVKSGTLAATNYRLGLHRMLLTADALRGYSTGTHTLRKLLRPQLLRWRTAHLPKFMQPGKLRFSPAFTADSKINAHGPYTTQVPIVRAFHSSSHFKLPEETLTPHDSKGGSKNCWRGELGCSEWLRCCDRTEPSNELLDDHGVDRRWQTGAGRVAWTTQLSLSCRSLGLDTHSMNTW